MSQAQVLQEYLIKLGYKTDLVSYKKFEDGMNSAGKLALKTGALVTGAVVALEVATSKFAYAMRNAYFTADLAGSTTQKMDAMAFAGKQVGISAENMGGTLKKLGVLLKTDPGLEALANGFGVKTKGRDVSDVAKDLMAALAQKPAWLRTNIAEAFGFDAETTLLWTQNIDKFNQKLAEAEKRQQALNPEKEKARKLTEEYTEAMDKLGHSFDMAAQNVMFRAMPAFKGFTDFLTKSFSGLSVLAGEGGWDKFLQNMRKNDPAMARLFDPIGKDTGASRPAPSAPAAVTTPDRKSAANRLNGLEKYYGLPSGLLESIWKTESGYGRNMGPSSAGAEGHFQFMPATAKEYGLKNPYDFNESSDAAARKMKSLLTHYRGDVNKALAAYNWGEGNLDRNGGRMPESVQKYVGDITGNMARLGVSGTGGGITQNNNTTINVTGSDPKAIGSAVAGAQSRVISDSLRNLKGATQ